MQASLDTRIGRDERHATLRSAGYGEKLDRLITMMGEHRAAFEEVIQLAEATTDRIARYILDQLALKARSGLRAIESTLDDPHLTGTHGSLGAWGINGRGPQVADMLRSARFHAKAGVGA